MHVWAILLHTELPGLLLILPQVPPYVAQRWKAVCDRSTNGAASIDDDEDAGDQRLGQITILQNSGEVNSWCMQCRVVQCTAGTALVGSWQQLIWHDHVMLFMLCILFLCLLVAIYARLQ